MRPFWLSLNPEIVAISALLTIYPTTLNHFASTIPKIKSIMAQMDHRFYLAVSDHLSTDELLDLIGSCEDFVYVKHPRSDSMMLMDVAKIFSLWL